MMEYKNFKSLSIDGLNDYVKELTSEYDKIKSKIDKYCEKIIEINDEYLDVMEEIKNRENYNGRTNN